VSTEGEDEPRSSIDELSEPPDFPTATDNLGGWTDPAVGGTVVSRGNEPTRPFIDELEEPESGFPTAADNMGGWGAPG